MALPPDVLHVLSSIRELGFVSVQVGRVSAVPPLGPMPLPLKYRWLYTLQYISDYASHHRNWSGEFFVCIYDGWREYSHPVDENDRQYVPWKHVDHKKFVGVGSFGEPRFRHRHEDITIYPELPRKILCYCRHTGDQNALLIPDCEFIGTGFASFLRQVKESDTPWEQKAGKVVWRGSPFPVTHALGVGNNLGGLHPRAAAVALSAKPEFSAVLDASFDTTSIAQMLRYKYQLDLDGMVSAYSALFWKLSSNSLVWKLKSPWEQWYYNRLLPGQHYVSLRALGELHSEFQRCEDDQADCQRIVARAIELMKTLTYDRAVSEYNIY
jgi:hypothetical protein